MRAALAFLTLTACGAKMDRDGADGSMPPIAATAPPLGQRADAAPAPSACTVCRANDDCAVGAGCVTSPGGGFCADGCTKEGFCRPGQVCNWVGDPAGTSWRACVPRDGCTVWH